MRQTRRGHRPRLQLFARSKRPENPEQSNVVFVAKERANIDKLSIADPMKRSGNFSFLGRSEEPIVFGDFTELNSGGEMPVDGALHEPAGTRDFID